MIESKSIETPATLVRFSIRAPQAGASVGDADGPFTKLYHEDRCPSKRVGSKTLGWPTVPSVLVTVEEGVVEAKQRKENRGLAKMTKNVRICTSVVMKHVFNTS